MFFALKIAGTILGIYGGIALAKVGVEWIREGIERMRPPKRW